MGETAAVVTRGVSYSLETAGPGRALIVVERGTRRPPTWGKDVLDVSAARTLSTSRTLDTLFSHLDYRITPFRDLMPATTPGGAACRPRPGFPPQSPKDGEPPDSPLLEVRDATPNPCSRGSGDGSASPSASPSGLPVRLWTCGHRRWAGVSFQSSVSRLFGPGPKAFDRRDDQACGNAICHRAGREGAGGVAEPIDEIGRTGPTRNGPPIAGEDHIEESEGKP